MLLVNFQSPNMVEFYCFVSIFVAFVGGFTEVLMLPLWKSCSSPCFWKVFLLDIGLQVYRFLFFFQNFKDVALQSAGFHCSNEKAAVIFVHFSACNVFFLLVAFKVFSLPLVLSNLIMTFLVWFSFGAFCLGFVELLESLGYIFYQIWEILSRIFLHVFVPSSFWDSNYKHIKFLVLTQSSLIFCLLFSVFFLSFHFG